MSYELLLASQSPRRKQLLSELGVPFSLTSSTFDERSVSEDMPSHEYVTTVARGKAENAQFSVGQIILASDLTVWKDKKLFHKPKNREEAKRTLTELWNGWHDEVGACVVGNSEIGWKSEVSISRVWLPELDPAAFEVYLDSADPTDKAGGIDIRWFATLAGTEKISIEGHYSTIIGLNVFATTRLLQEFGVSVRTSPETVEAEIQQSILSAQSE